MLALCGLLLVGTEPAVKYVVHMVLCYFLQMKISVNVPAFAKVHRYTKFQNCAIKGVIFVHISEVRTTSMFMLLMGGILITNSL
jgi:hypothetical protein